MSCGRAAPGVLVAIESGLVIDIRTSLLPHDPCPACTRECSAHPADNGAYWLTKRNLEQRPKVTVLEPGGPGPQTGMTRALGDHSLVDRATPPPGSPHHPDLGPVDES